MNAIVLHPPDDYNKLLGKDQHLVKHVTQLKETVDFIHAFYTEKKDLKKEFSILAKNLNVKGMIWISWPKKTSHVRSDLDENIVRDIGLALGVVDVKVCAVSEIWSGLKFLRRKNEL